MKLTTFPDRDGHICSAFRGVSIAFINPVHLRQVTHSLTPHQMAQLLVRRWNILEGLPFTLPRLPDETDQAFVARNMAAVVPLLERLTAKEPT